MSYSNKRVRGSRSGGPRRFSALPSVQQKRQARGGKLTMLFSIALGMGILVGLILMVMIGHGGSTATASGGGPGVPVGYGSLNHPKGPCGNTGQSSCASPNPDWFAIGSETPAAAAAVIAGSKDFLGIAAQHGCSLLDTPALVYSFGARTGMDYYDDDHWVVSVRDSTGMRCGLADFVYDRAHKRMRFSSFGVLTPQDPHSRQVFPYVSSPVAVAQLQNQHKLAPLSGTVEKLIFFPIDPSFPYLNSPAHKWAGGGNSAMNPMWYIVGADGRGYFLGEDMHIYKQTDLPIAKGQP
jgi:hypothetical protein